MDAMDVGLVPTLRQCSRRVTRRLRCAAFASITVFPRASMKASASEPAALQDQIKSLEAQLQDARSRLEASNKGAPASNGAPRHDVPAPSLHTLLLLADSALPLGSFAFSSGLESYLAHHPRSPTSPTPLTLFQQFLDLSLQSLAGTALPYVLAAHGQADRLLLLDNDLDASTVCSVARRASVAQGKALLAVWDRAFRKEYERNGPEASVKAAQALASFSAAIKDSADDQYPPSGHLAPLWGAVTLALGLTLESSAYLFLFSHARTVVSAAVRASVLGPYQAQRLLAAQGLRERIETLVEEHREWTTEQACQTVPIMDLWIGRHELLYSRIFNS